MEPAGRTNNGVHNRGDDKAEINGKMSTTAMNMNMKTNRTYLCIRVSIHGRAGTIGAGTRIPSRSSCLVLHRPVSE